MAKPYIYYSTMNFFFKKQASPIKAATGWKQVSILELQWKGTSSNHSVVLHVPFQEPGLLP